MSSCVYNRFSCDRESAKPNGWQREEPARGGREGGERGGRIYSHLACLSGYSIGRGSPGDGALLLQERLLKRPIVVFNPAKGTSEYELSPVCGGGGGGGGLHIVRVVFVGKVNQTSFLTRHFCCICNTPFFPIVRGNVRVRAASSGKASFGKKKKKVTFNVAHRPCGSERDISRCNAASASIRDHAQHYAYILVFIENIK